MHTPLVVIVGNLLMTFLILNFGYSPLQERCHTERADEPCQGS